MTETHRSNIEVAHHLSEHRDASRAPTHEIVEIVEAIVLAVVALATAWSGYQAALWTGQQSELYGEASMFRVQAEEAAAAANQEGLWSCVGVGRQGNPVDATCS